MTAWNRNSIIEFIQTHKSTLREMGVNRIGLFGSYARNEQSTTSDIDLLISLEPFTFANWMDVWNYFEDHMNCEVDLVPEKDLREEIRDQVLSEVYYVEINEGFELLT